MLSTSGTVLGNNEISVVLILNNSDDQFLICSVSKVVYLFVFCDCELCTVLSAMGI